MFDKLSAKLLVLAIIALCAIALPTTASAAKSTAALSAPAQTGEEPAQEPAAPEQSPQTQSIAASGFVQAIAVALARTLDFVSVVPEGVTLSFNVPVGEQLAAVRVTTQDIQSFSVVVEMDRQTVELRGLKLQDDAFILDNAVITLPDGAGAASISGLQLADGSLAWNGVQVDVNSVAYGDAVAISDLVFALTNTGPAVVTDASARINLSAGETMDLGGQVQLSFDGYTPQVNMSLYDASLLLQWNDLGVQAQGVAYDSSVWSAADTSIWWRAAGLTGFISDLRLQPVEGLTYSTLGAELSFADTPIRVGNADLQKFSLSISPSETGYILTTQSHLAPPIASGQ